MLNKSVSPIPEEVTEDRDLTKVEAGSNPVRQGNVPGIEVWDHSKGTEDVALAGAAIPIMRPRVVVRAIKDPAEAKEITEVTMVDVQEVTIRDMASKVAGAVVAAKKLMAALVHLETVRGAETAEPKGDLEETGV
ncbi:hypothetical protein [Novipirellula artificiosorum]|uniref:Uncharacterized protein n=1 Tax=Novipirellula artificiosorum TaxID=2528016 RepID=A0A5C6DZ80_9BACT|nr:hypothetical protein [Novipirellula artificiosorum]TWU42763.1 hypothetical protein Poly41_10630 [Novipirellula artificiosorum]